jgi:hypothetical protein
MVETLTAPGTPTGTAHVASGTSHTYATTGATSSLGHAVEYRWTWGDGSLSAWLSAALGVSVAHTYTTTAIRTITVQARCVAHPTILSAASAGLSVGVYHDTVAGTARTSEAAATARTTETVAA